MVEVNDDAPHQDGGAVAPGGAPQTVVGMDLTRPPRVLDFFAGCGGLSKGLELAGMDIVGAYEFWEPAAKVYEANFSHPVNRADLSTLDDFSDIVSVGADIIVGGPPCQDFSSAGKRDETGGRADLTLTYANIVTEVKPAMFVMENVPRAQTTNTFRQALDVFRTGGYGLTVVVLDASFFRVPQARKRLFVVGVLGGKDNELLDYLRGGATETPMTVRQHFGTDLDIDNYYRHPRSYARRAIFSVDEPSATIRGVNRPPGPGYPGHPGDPVGAEGVRALTTAERAQIQTFPKSFCWDGASKTAREQMIGNAVPVNLAKHVGDAIVAFIHGQPPKVDETVSALTLF